MISVVPANLLDQIDNRVDKIVYRLLSVSLTNSWRFEEVWNDAEEARSRYR